MCERRACNTTTMYGTRNNNIIILRPTVESVVVCSYECVSAAICRYESHMYMNTLSYLQNSINRSINTSVSSLYGISHAVHAPTGCLHKIRPTPVFELSKGYLPIIGYCRNPILAQKMEASCDSAYHEVACGCANIWNTRNHAKRNRALYLPAAPKWQICPEVFALKRNSIFIQIVHQFPHCGGAGMGYVHTLYWS